MLRVLFEQIPLALQPLSSHAFTSYGYLLPAPGDFTEGRDLNAGADMLTAEKSFWPQNEFAPPPADLCRKKAPARSYRSFSTLRSPEPQGRTKGMLKSLSLWN